MRKALLMFAALAVFAFAADGGMAAKGPKPKQEQSAAASVRPCKAPRKAVLKGTFVAASGETGFTMDVTKANAHGRKLAGKKGFAVAVDAKSKFTRDDASAKLADLVAGDRLNVQAVLCKGADAEAASFLARRVVARPAEAAAESGTPTG